MIRFIDAVTLAHTKLRTHRIRTGIAIGIAGILFGLILGVIFVTQGVFDSINRFGKEGLNDRAVINVMQMDNPFRAYDFVRNKEFIAEVKQQHADQIVKKQAAAKKFGIPYNPERDDPSPVLIDDEAKEEYLEDVGHPAVQAAAQARTKPSNFDIYSYVKSYGSTIIHSGNKSLVNLPNASLDQMIDGKEFSSETGDGPKNLNYNNSGPRSLTVTSQSLVDPFINKESGFDPTKGEIPMVLPFSDAEKLLGLEPLKKDATTQDKYDRLKDVRRRVGEVTAAFCYRNNASKQLVSEAKSQLSNEKKNKNKESYVKPILRYILPADDSCGAVTTAYDNRTAREKDYDARQVAFEKELGIYAGDPEQYKVILRAVGISGDTPSVSGGAFNVADMVNSLLGSWLGYDAWIIPSELLKQVPEAQRPEVIFGGIWAEDSINAHFEQKGSMNSYLVEFKDQSEAQRFMKDNSVMDLKGKGYVAFANPFGSSMLLIEDMKSYFQTILMWTLLVVGGVAVIILGSVIGRTVSEGRRESSIFRAIGARRGDIGLIYGTYAFLLSLWVVVFTVALGLILSLTVEVWIGKEATLATRYAYAAAETDATFHFFGLFSLYVPLVVVAIIIFGMIASIIPVILSARRNPMKDMRDDT